MTRITTSTGYEIDFDESVLDDMELFDTIVEVDKGNTSALPEMLNMLLTPAQKKALYDHCRGENGRVSIKAIGEEVKEIFERLKNPEKK